MKLSAVSRATLIILTSLFVWGAVIIGMVRAI